MSSFSFTFAGHNTTCANRNSPSSSRHRHQRFHAHARFRLDAIHQCPSVRFLPEEGQLLVISIDSIPLKLKKKTIFFLVSQIWLREALQCRNCGLVCHKKCIKRFPDRKWCGLDDFYIPTIPIAIDTPKVGCLVVEFIAFFRLSLFTKMGKP